MELSSSLTMIKQSLNSQDEKKIAKEFLINTFNDIKESISNNTNNKKIQTENPAPKKNTAAKKLLNTLQTIQFLVRLKDNGVIGKQTLIDNIRLSHGNSESDKSALNNSEILGTYKQALLSKIGVPAQEGSLDAIKKYSSEARKPLTLFEYLNNHAEETQNDNTHQTLKDMAILLLGPEEAFKNYRYDTDENPHLKTIAESHPDVYQKWAAPTQEQRRFEQTDFTPRKSKEYTAMISDNPEDLFLSGTEVHGSCQHATYADTELNCGLQSYVLDGKIKILAIKNNENEIVARQMIRILLNNKDEPVLFADKLYFKTGHNTKTFTSQLDTQIKTYAQMLKIPYVAPDKVADYGPLRALENRGTPEYVDGGTAPNPHSQVGIHTQGTGYTIL